MKDIGSGPPAKARKPLPPVKVGSVSIPRYQLGDGRVMIAYPTATQPRKCQTFTGKGKDEKARLQNALTRSLEEATRIARELHNGGQEAQIFTSADRADFTAAKRDVAAHGVPVHVATSEWNEAKKQILGIRYSLQEVIAAGVHALSRTPHPVPTVVAELLASQAQKDLHGRYRDGMQTTFANFAEAFPGEIREVKAPQIQRWLDGTVANEIRSGGLRKRNGDPVGPRRRDNILKEVRLLFQYARLHGYLPDEISEAKKVPLIDEGGGEISYFTIAEMRLILEHVQPDWLPFVVLLVFNGFRTEELVRHRQANRRKDPLRWEDFDFEEGEIYVREATSKVDRKRIVPLHDVTREWLAPYRQSRGLIAPEKRTDREFGKGSRLERAINAALKQAPRLRNDRPVQMEMQITSAPPDELLTEFAWRHNALRHSYGSYRASILKNVHQLAEEMGTSPEMIHKHYRNPRPASQARAWFAIKPPQSGIVVPFPAAQSA
ncbi:MAG TPA: site-specific integrase [Chthoniobacteraceae bacterium]|jgi:integrase